MLKELKSDELMDVNGGLSLGKGISRGIGIIGSVLIGGCGTHVGCEGKLDNCDAFRTNGLIPSLFSGSILGGIAGIINGITGKAK